MKNNKGFASVAIVFIIIGVLAVGGIAYKAGKNNSTYSPPVEQNENIPAINSPVQTPPVEPPQQQEIASNCPPASPILVQVMYPNGGETFDISQNVPDLNLKISWLMCHIPTNHARIKLQQGTHFLLLNSNNNFLLGTPAAQPNEYANFDVITKADLLAAGMTSGGGYRIVISDNNNPNFSDSSDSDFSITINNAVH